jgi:hypothetical protein
MGSWRSPEPRAPNWREIAPLLRLNSPKKPCFGIKIVRRIQSPFQSPFPAGIHITKNCEMRIFPAEFNEEKFAAVALAGAP